MGKYRYNKPYFSSDKDYTTNAPSYYDALARFSEALKNLTERMNDVEQRFKDLMLKWLEDGTLAGLLEQVLLDDYATKDYVQQAIDDLNIDDYAKKEWVNDVLNEYIDMVNQLVDDVNERMDQLEQDVKEILEKQKDDLIDLIESKEVKSEGGLYQTLLTEPFTGFDGSQIFEGAEHSPQGITYIEYEGKEKIFMLIRTRGSSWGASEYSRIIEYELKNDGSITEYINYSNEIKVGHQGISAFIEDDQLYFITGATTGNKPNTTKGFSKVKWNGSDTKQKDVSSYKVFGDTDTDHNLEAFYNATPCISPDGKHVVIATSVHYDANTRYIVIYNLEQIEKSTDPLCEPPLNVFRIESPPQIDGHVTQDLACDGEKIYIFSGYTEYPSVNAVNVYSMTGRHLGYFSVEGAYGDYTLDQLKDGDGILGEPKYFEAEGITIKDNELLILTNDVWELDGEYSKRTQKLHSISTEKKDRSKPINRGFISIESPASLHLRGTTRDLSIPKGDAFQISFWDEFERKFYDMMIYAGQHALQLYDANEGSDHNKYAQIGVHFDPDSEYTIFRGDRTNDEGAGFNAHSKDSSTAGRFSLHFGQGTDHGEDRIYFTGEGDPKVYPRSDGDLGLGSPNHKWSEIYASDGEIKTSDRNYKQQIKDIDDNVLNAWSEVDYISYKFNKAVDKKGSEKARKHIGIIAQDIIEKFEKHGIDAFEYGIVGYDKWEDKEPLLSKDGEIINDGEQAGEMYSIRADECLFLESALMRRELKEIKKRVSGGE